jgi:hypothetical protein
MAVAHFLDAADTSLYVILDEHPEYEAEIASYADGEDTR